MIPGNTGTNTGLKSEIRKIKNNLGDLAFRNDAGEHQGNIRGCEGKTRLFDAAGGDKDYQSVSEEERWHVGDAAGESLFRSKAAV